MEVSAQQVLLSLFNAQDTVCLRVFADRKDDIYKGQKLSVECGKFTSIEDMLKEHNALHRGIFYVVNYGGHDDDSITRINAQFVEMDSGSFEEQQKKIDAFPLAPSMIIKTKKSLHTYWFISGGEVIKFRPIQKGLVKYFDGDPACVNESRVMRLPGYDHCKKDHVKVECILFHPERKYTQAQLIEHLPQVETEAPVETKKGSEKGLNIVTHECDFIKHCKQNSAILPEHDWYAMISNLAVLRAVWNSFTSCLPTIPVTMPETRKEKSIIFWNRAPGLLPARPSQRRGLSVLEWNQANVNASLRRLCAIFRWGLRGFVP